MPAKNDTGTIISRYLPRSEREYFFKKTPPVYIQQKRYIAAEQSFRTKPGKSVYHNNISYHVIIIYIVLFNLKYLNRIEWISS